MKSKPRTVWLTSARIPEQFRDDLKAWSKRLGMSQSKILEAAFYEWAKGFAEYQVTFKIPEKGTESFAVFALNESDAINKARKIAADKYKEDEKHIHFIDCMELPF